jgi:DNA-binding NtrC family response regulator
MNGLQLLGTIKAQWPDVPVIVVTVDEEVATIVDAIHRGAVNYLVKPVAPPSIQDAAARALARAPAAHAPQGQGSQEIVGSSPAIEQVRRMAALASQSDVNVVIVGETGTGKELVARAIHRASSLSTHPFIAHNCAVTSPELFDAEFFGHRRGAFTGADSDRAGLLRQARGGVLFLDELECMSLVNQAKLLRVLDDGVVRPVGSDVSFPVSIRFLGATNRSPESMFASGHLREDFYFRLCGFLIALPPLRQRPGDIPLLADHFLGGPGRLTPAAVDALERYSWPGNVRQLRNTLRGALSRSPDGPIEPGHFDLEWRTGESSAPPVSDVRTKLNLEAMQRQAILDALAAHRGNRSRAADELGIHRSTLQRKLRELAIEPRPRRQGDAKK